METLSHLNNMKKTIIALAFAMGLISVSSCAKEARVDREYPDKLKIETNYVTLREGQTSDVPLIFSRFDRGIYVKEDYDYILNPHNVVFSSSDDKVVSVSKTGVITAVGVGTARITGLADVKVGGYVDVTVKEETSELHSFDGDIENTALTPSRVFMPLGIVHTTMQGFDFDMSGNIYIAWEENDVMHVRKFVNGAPSGSDMLLPCSGHGDGFCIEQNSTECYFWTTGSLGNENGGYKGGKAADDGIRYTCRFKFEAGTTKYPEDAESCYFLNANGARICDIDEERDVIAFWSYGSKDFCSIYKLSELRSAAQVSYPVTRTHNSGTIVSAYNLNSLTPLGSFQFDRGMVCGTRVSEGVTSIDAVQGFTVYDGKLFFESGVKTDAAAKVTVMDFKGQILKDKIPVGVSADKDKIVKLNLSSDGTFEPEGIHIRKGVMYLGFVGDYPTSGSKKHSCILKVE